MTATSQPQQEIISPAEAQFWQEQADRAPALLRKTIAEDVAKFNGAMQNYKIGGIAVGAVLAAATFTKHVPGKWKIVSAMGAAAALLTGSMAGSGQKAFDQVKDMLLGFAGVLEQNPEVRQTLARELQQAVTAQDIQQLGLDRAIAASTATIAIGLLDAKRQSHVGKISLPASQNNPQLAL